ncbi:queuosine precursor transporter [Candidatus Peregrinibacteria bacterium]|jgi:queuosine precursor transporter|nr:queuosine precursor transporter [Candidatus Peregrinibacteria bacterium]MBT7483513.1 queuosine precursor transporter [Candidatus Peregrinibacteria bacterium]MBT7703044.1 queuosine precursor transporter [Candidatus Peregrinibacteria bacterium]
MFEWTFNEPWFLLQALVALSFVLLCFRLGRSWLIAYIAISVVLLNLVVMKQVNVFSLEATLGNVIYASLFFATDLLSEHYGKKEAFKAVRIGFFAGIFGMVMLQFALKYAPSEFDFVQGSFETLFTLAPRIVGASLFTYLVTQNLDVWIYHAIKKRTGEKYLWMRNLGSTAASQLVDSFMFTYLAFYGHFEVLHEIAFFTFVIKMLVAFMDTPFIYLSRIAALEPENVRKREHTRIGRLISRISGESVD